MYTMQQHCTWHSGLPWTLWSEKWWWAYEKWSCNRLNLPDGDPVAPLTSCRFIPTYLLSDKNSCLGQLKIALTGKGSRADTLMVV